MKTIIIEQSVYKVTDREFNILKEMEKRIKHKEYKRGLKYENELNDYLDVAKILYKFIGTVDFHCQR